MYRDILNSIRYEMFYDLGLPVTLISRFCADLVPLFSVVIGIHIGIRCIKYFLNV